MHFVLGDYLEMIYRQLERMPGADPTLSEMERIAFARRAAPIKSLGDYNAAMLALIDRGGYRPSPSEFGEIVKKACGFTEIDDLPPAQRAIYRTDRSLAAEEARLRDEQECRFLEGAPVDPSQASARDRAREVIASLAKRTSTTLEGQSRYSYGPEQWRTPGPDPMDGVPEEEQSKLLDEAAAMLRTIIRQPHPAKIRTLAAKLYHNQEGAMREMEERRRQFATVLGGAK